MIEMKQEPFQDEKIRVDGLGCVDRVVVDTGSSSIGSDDVIGASGSWGPSDPSYHGFLDKIRRDKIR